MRHPSASTASTFVHSLSFHFVLWNEWEMNWNWSPLSACASLPFTEVRGPASLLPPSFHYRSYRSIHYINCGGFIPFRQSISWLQLISFSSFITLTVVAALRVVTSFPSVNHFRSFLARSIRSINSFDFTSLHLLPHSLIHSHSLITSVWIMVPDESLHLYIPE